MINSNNMFCFAFDMPVISNAIYRKRIKIDKITCAKLILGIKAGPDLESILNNVGINISSEADDYDVLHWKKRNWSISLSYYLWSRKDHLYDKGEDFKISQKQVIDHYIESEGFPEDKKISSKSAIALDFDQTDLPLKSLKEILVAREAVLAPPRRTITKKVLSTILQHGFYNLSNNRKNNLELNPISALDSFGVAFDVYLCIYSVQGIKSGIYFYDLENHKIDLVQSVEENDLRALMYSIQVEQKAAKTASFSVILVANFKRYQWRYRHEAALKHLYINCGQIIHNPMLMATLFDYKTHISPAIMDSLASDLLKIDGCTHQAMYILSIG